MVRNGIHFIFFHFVVQSRNVEGFRCVGKFSSQHCIHVDSAVRKKAHCQYTVQRHEEVYLLALAPCEKMECTKQNHVHLHAPYVHFRPVRFVSQDLWGCISWRPALGLKMLPSRLSVRRRDKKRVAEAKI